MGDVLRAEVKNNPVVWDCLEQGQLVPDDVVLSLVHKWLKQHAHEGFVLDGFPRTLVQARLLDESLAREKERIHTVLYLNSTQGKAEERIRGRLVCRDCGRNFHSKNRPPAKEGKCDDCGGPLLCRMDDDVSTLRKRWDVYHRETEGLVNYYRERGILREIPADGSADELFSGLEKELVWQAPEKL